MNKNFFNKIQLLHKGKSGFTPPPKRRTPKSVNLWWSFQRVLFQCRGHKVLVGGFTLVEALVAITIFSFASVIITTIFLNANNLQKNTANWQHLQSEMRYIIEKVARETRARELSYPLNQIDNKLLFQKNENGEAAQFYLDNGNLVYQVTLADGSVQTANINASDIQVEEVKFFVVPAEDSQWGEPPLNNLQPRVTVWLKLKNITNNAKFLKELAMQTTISSRFYKR